MGDLVELCFQIFALYVAIKSTSYIYYMCVYPIVIVISVYICYYHQWRLSCCSCYFISKLFSLHWLYEINIVVISSDRGYIVIRAVIVVIVWQLDLQLLMQSEPITTNVVSSNLAHGEVYSVQFYVIKFLSDLWQVGGFLHQEN